MFDQALVLGVDPGTAAVGLALVDAPRAGARGVSVAWAKTIRTPSGVPAAERLRTIYREVRDVVERNTPAAVALERLMWGRNAANAMEVARASGVIMLAAAESGVAVEEYAPLEVKMAVTGVGNATKELVRRGLVRLIGVEGVPDDPDAADAVAVAVCHLQQSRLRRLTKEAVR
jgi:crossover junction endodeoxyribonuclease RuvC